jgi:ligand-binding sensor domain-containing protein
MVKESEARNVRIRRSLPLCALLLILVASPLRAVDPNRHISQYAHTTWRVQDGAFKGAPYAIAQANGGYLWIGTADGLFRFDGVRFVRWASPDGPQLPSTLVLRLLAARDGSLWIGSKDGLSHLENDHLVNFTDPDHHVYGIAQDHDGTIWVTRNGPNPLCQLSGQSMKCYGTADGIPFTHISQDSLTVDAIGDFWIGSDTSFLRWKPGSSTLYSPSRLKANAGMLGVSAFAQDADGSVWSGTVFPGAGMGLQHLVQGAWHPFTTPGFDSSSLEVRTLFIDSQNALWIGTTHQGIYRIFANNIDQFQATDGLSGNEVSHFLEDSEGNMWVVTSGGIDKFSNLTVATYSTPEGITTTEVDAVLAAHDGTVWIGGADALDTLHDGKVSSIQGQYGLLGKQVTSLLEDDKHRLWVGIDNTLNIYENGTFHPIEKPDGSSLGMIADMAEDNDKNIWVETAGPPRALVRVLNDKVQQVFLTPPFPTNRRVAAGSAGTVWLGTKTGNLVRFQDGHATLVDFKQDHDARVEQVMVNSDGSVLGATELGLIAWKDGKQQMMTVRNGIPCNDIFAIIGDNDENLWLYTKCGLVSISNNELQNWWQHPESLLKFKFFDEFSGVRPGIAPFQKAARSPDGRLWFANNVVLQMVDPHRLYENALPPPVHIEEVLADQTAYTPAQGLRLPPLTREIEIDYTALSFTVPQKVRFRYKLDGHDADWQDSGTRRQAFYNDLGPGTFTFHVLACNNDGVWNEVGASLQFTVTPAWYQTNWFRLLCTLTGVLLVWLIYQFRVRQIARVIAAKFDERLQERTRLARELHDTFFQTVQGSKMVADDALDPGSDETRMRKALEKLSTWLAQAVDEGRAALHSLRVSTVEKNHLSESLQRATEDPQFPASMTVTFSVIGDAMDLHPVVRDDVYRIAFEAIRNAALHSHASLLEIELRYADTLSLRIKDNGIGIDPSISDHGKAGHFGLLGMRERAARIQSKLTMVSSTNAGTEVALVVPGKVVYRNARPTLPQRAKAAVVRLFGNSNLYDK